MPAIYRPIVGYPNYRVGSDGTVWSRRVRGPRGQRRDIWSQLSTYRRPYGAKYTVVCMRAIPGGQVSCLYVHRLVLETFVGPCPEGMLCCHNDGNSANNSVGNLRWGRPKDNGQDTVSHGRSPCGERNPSAVLTESQVRTIRDLGARGIHRKTIAKKFKISAQHASDIIHRRRWKHLA